MLEAFLRFAYDEIEKTPPVSGASSAAPERVRGGRWETDAVP